MNRLNIDLTEMSYNTGFAPANNVGIKKAIKDGCNYILTLNNDVEVPKESLKKAMEAIDTNKEFDVFQLFMINYFNKDVCDAAGLNFKDDLIPLQVGFKENVAEILNKDDIKIEGHAIECRINAENPKKSFAPCPGKISFSLHTLKMLIYR